MNTWTWTPISHHLRPTNNIWVGQEVGRLGIWHSHTQWTLIFGPFIVQGQFLGGAKSRWAGQILFEFLKSPFHGPSNGMTQSHLRNTHFLSFLGWVGSGWGGLKCFCLITPKWSVTTALRYECIWLSTLVKKNWTNGRTNRRKTGQWRF